MKEKPIIITEDAVLLKKQTNDSPDMVTVVQHYMKSDKTEEQVIKEFAESVKKEIQKDIESYSKRKLTIYTGVVLGLGIAFNELLTLANVNGVELVESNLKEDDKQ